MSLLFLLSPAKSLDYERPVPPELSERATRPLFADRAAELIARLKTLSPAEVATLMELSDSLAQLNVARYAAWSRRFTDANSRPAVLAFDGDVYDGLQARSLSPDDLDWAQQHVVILSGLYGVLRPLDRLQAYRLEMGRALANPAGKDLYAFWGDSLAEYLNQRQARQRQPVIVNLASLEYAKAARRPALKARVIDCVFEDWKSDQWKVVSFHAKRARGLMLRFAIEHRLSDAAGLDSFSAEGYRFTPEVSTPAKRVFRRRDAGGES